MPVGIHTDPIIKTKEKQLNQSLIDNAKALVGIKGYVTNLDTSDEQIINYYHRLWPVEQSFRMSKSDLKARPIFHHLKDSIEAHLTVVMAALAVQRSTEEITSTSLKQLVKILRPIHSGRFSIAGKNYPAKARISLEAKNLIEKLKA